MRAVGVERDPTAICKFSLLLLCALKYPSNNILPLSTLLLKYCLGLVLTLCIIVPWKSGKTPLFPLARSALTYQPHSIPSELCQLDLFWCSIRNSAMREDEWLDPVK